MYYTKATSSELAKSRVSMQIEGSTFATRNFRRRIRTGCALVEHHAAAVNRAVGLHLFKKWISVGVVLLFCKFSELSTSFTEPLWTCFFCKYFFYEMHCHFEAISDKERTIDGDESKSSWDRAFHTQSCFMQLLPPAASIYFLGWNSLL